MLAGILALIIIVQAAALLWVVTLWRHQRARAEKLERLQVTPTERTAARGRATVKAVLETAALLREKGVGGALRSSIEELAGWAEVEQPDLQRLAARDGTVTIFFSDIENSTSHNEELGDRAWLKVLDGHDRIVHQEVGKHDGHIIKSQGDGFMIAFASPAEAMRCGIGIQRALASGYRRLRGTQIRVRIGIHAGVAVQREGDLFGRNVALAARVATRANGGQILVTPEVSAAVDHDDDEFTFTDAGSVELKGFSGEYRIQELNWN